jgi:DNA adenine methylase
VHRDGAAADLAEVFAELSARLRRVRVCCGDWTRVLGHSTLGIDTAHGMTPCGVLLDGPYAHDGREKRLYSEDDAALSGNVRAWAIENGPNPRGMSCSPAQPHSAIRRSGWTQVAWRSKGSGKNRGKERIWFSPQCAPALSQDDLFGGLDANVLERST